jgi:hypothetical protein
VARDTDGIDGNPLRLQRADKLDGVAGLGLPPDVVIIVIKLRVRIRGAVEL